MAQNIGDIAKALNGTKSGTGYICLCPAHGDKNPSLALDETTDGKILLHCFSGCSYESIVTALKEQDLWIFHKSSTDKNKANTSSSDQSARSAQNKETCIKIWEEAQSIYSPDSVLGQMYLKNRSLAIPEDDSSLKVSPNLKYSGTGPLSMKMPALLMKVSDLQGNIQAIQRIFLSIDGTKAKVDSPKKLLGSPNRGSIKFGSPEKILHIAEGPENALAVYTALKVATWSGISASHMKAMDLPTDVEVYHVWADSGPIERKAAADLANRILDMGKKVYIHIPVLPGHEKPDWNDILKAQGALPFQISLEQDTEYEAESTPLVKGKIFVSEQQGDIITSIWDLVHTVNQGNAKLFIQNGNLLQIDLQESGPKLAFLNLDQFKHFLATHSDWVAEKVLKEGEVKVVLAGVPREVAAMAFSTPDRTLPSLEKLNQVPYFARDGQLITDVGYNKSEKTYLTLPSDFNLPKLVKKPTEEDIVAAKKLIFDDLLGDFPFYKPSDKAHYLCILLQQLVRNLIDGPTPLYSIEAPAKGAGKTLLVEVAQRVCFGKPANGKPYPKSEDEMQKKILTFLTSEPDMIFFDNVPTGTVDSASLAHVLTSTEYSDRVLGKTQERTVKNKCLWVMTGNNLDYSEEIGRRCVTVRLLPKEVAAWQRKPSEFKHNDLKKWVSQNRLKILSSLYTLVLYWVSKGMPEAQRSPSIGSFESWSGVMGGILEICEISGFLEDHAERMAVLADDYSNIQELVNKWWQVFGERTVRPRDLLENNEILHLMAVELNLHRPHGLLSEFGKFLMSIRDKTFGNFKVLMVADKGPNKGRTYKLQKVVLPREKEQSSQQFEFAQGDVGDVSSSTGGKNE